MPSFAKCWWKCTPNEKLFRCIEKFKIDGAFENTTAYITDIINNDLLSSEQKTVGYLSFMQIALTSMQTLIGKNDFTDKGINFGDTIKYQPFICIRHL